MTKEEVEYEILKIFSSKINFEFESYSDLWEQYHRTFHCPRETFNEVLSEFESAGYIDLSSNGHFTPSLKSKRAYINHHIGRYKEKQQQDRENEKFNQEIKALKFNNSKTYKLLTLGGMLIGIIGGAFGIASYYKKDPDSITKDQLKIYVDSLRQIDESKFVDHESLRLFVDSTIINYQEPITLDSISKNPHQ